MKYVRTERRIQIKQPDLAEPLKQKYEIQLFTNMTASSIIV